MIFISFIFPSSISIIVKVFEYPNVLETISSSPLLFNVAIAILFIVVSYFFSIIFLSSSILFFISLSSSSNRLYSSSNNLYSSLGSKTGSGYINAHGGGHRCLGHQHPLYHQYLLQILHLYPIFSPFCEISQNIK